MNETNRPSRPRKRIGGLDADAMERVCAEMESGKPAWEIARAYETSTTMLYHIYRKFRGASWSARNKAHARGRRKCANAIQISPRNERETP